jgi:hypothetical protein
MIVVDLCRKIQTLKCKEVVNVCTHFDNITGLCEQLAAMGKTITDNEYTSILLSSLPITYNATTSAIATTASLTGTTLTPNTVIHLVTDEFYWCTLKAGKPMEGQDEAMSTETGKKKRLKKDIKCFNCKKLGHVKADFWAKGGGKEGQGPKKKGQDSTVSAEQQQPDIEAWAAIEEILEEDMACGSWWIQSTRGLDQWLCDAHTKSNLGLPCTDPQVFGCPMSCFGIKLSRAFLPPPLLGALS